MEKERERERTFIGGSKGSPSLLDVGHRPRTEEDRNAGRGGGA